MPPNGTPGSRKRNRHENDNEPEPSPKTKDSIGPAIKKRRFNGNVAPSPSSPSTPKGLSAITSAVGGALSKRLASSRTASHAISAYDVPNSDDDGHISASPTKHGRPAISHSKIKRLKGKTPNGRATSSAVYDVPDSDGELENATPTGRSKRRAESPTKKRGSRANGGAVTPNGKASTPRGKSSRKNDDFNMSVAENSLEDTPSKPRSSRSKKPLPQNGHGSPSQQASTVQPKGILTPQKRGPGRPRKSVAFDGSGAGDQVEVFFKDIPSKSKAASSAPNSRSTVTEVIEAEPEACARDQQDDDEDGEDDEVCAICSKPDSEAPNEIIFCDNCDMAVHQLCYNVPEIPEGDWLCRNCSQEDVLASQEGAQSTVKAAGSASEIPDIPNFEQHLGSIQRILLDRCSGRRRLKLRGHDEAYDKAMQLVEQTVVAGEGNSMMVIGARGCGKTTLVETILSNLAGEQKEAFHVIRLNGFIHTDDKLALKEIWRQLGKEMEVEDDLVNKTTNYADTLASLLALLSHPSEITGAESDVTSKSVIFVIDEFDLFATHARQTLLYNLFDIAQARKAPIAVLGLTTRIDVVESLEKRVKSRFSHRYVYISMPKSLPAYWDICKQGLIVDEDNLEAEGLDTVQEGMIDFLQWWKKKIEALRNTSSFQDHLEYYYYTSKSVPAFLSSCILPLSALSPTSLTLNIPSGSDSLIPLEPPDNKLHLLSALADLDLALIIAATRLDIVAHTDTINFAMAYDEYSSLMGKQRVQSAGTGMLALGAGARVWSRGVAAIAWERLVALGLLLPAGVGGRSNAIHGGLESRMWKVEVALEEIALAVELPGFLSKWCTQI